MHDDEIRTELPRIYFRRENAPPIVFSPYYDASRQILFLHSVCHLLEPNQIIQNLVAQIIRKMAKSFLWQFVVLWEIENIKLYR